MKEPEPYRDADIWFSETEEEEETQWDPTADVEPFVTEK